MVALGPDGRHTPDVRWPCILVISLAAFGGEARAESPASTDFWRDVVEPHADEVRDLVTKSRSAMKIADEALLTDAEWAVEQRMRYFETAYGMLRHARKLSPENGEVLGLLGRAADELGKTRQAIEAYDACLRVLGPEKAGPDVTGRLGAIYVRMGDRDNGIRWLRQATGALTPITAAPMAQLANALASRGEVAAGVEVLQAALPAQVTYYSPEVMLLTFTLAVVYDRDEQRGAAFEVLDKMKSTQQLQFGPQLQNVLASTRFSPAEDQHYYLGLLYESVDQLTEARAEFAMYAASGDTPWRARALDHIRAIDVERRTAKPKLLKRVQQKPLLKPVVTP